MRVPVGAGLFRCGVGIAGEIARRESKDVSAFWTDPERPSPPHALTVDSTWLEEWPSQPPWLLWPPRPPSSQHPSSISDIAVTSSRFPGEKDMRISQPIAGTCSWQFPWVQGPGQPGLRIDAPCQSSVPQFPLCQISPITTLRDLQKLLTRSCSINTFMAPLLPPTGVLQPSWGPHAAVTRITMATCASKLQGAHYKTL